MADLAQYREFRDSGGTTWKVWEVIPPLTISAPPIEAPSPEAPVEGPIIEADRRWRERRAEKRALWQAGWLLFESDAARRRLMPIPQNWRSMSMSELEGMCLRAAPIR